MTITLDPIEIEESEESRRAREEQARRDDEARRAASEALDSVAPQLEQLANGGDPPEQSPAERAARAPTQPGSTFASVPGARRTGATGVVLPGRPAAPPPDRSQPMRQEAMTASPTPRMDQLAVASGSDPQMRAQQSPTFRAPQPDMRVLREPPPNPQRDAARAEVMAQRDAIARKPERPEPGRMDEGLPSEGQIGDARARDVMRLIAAALAGGFAGYSGRGGGVRARREADELTQQRQQGIARREQAKGAEVQRMDQRAERDAAREQEMTLAQQRLAESARERDAGLDIQRQRLGLQERATDARLQESERTRQEGVLLDDPSTPPSRQYQMLLRTRIASLPDRQRASIVQELGGADGISQMTGREIQRYLEHGVLPNPPQMRGTGGGGGGGVRAPGREGVSRQQASQERIQAAVARGIDPATAEQLERDGDLARITAQDALTRGPQQRAQEYGERIAMSGLARADQALRAVEDFIRTNPGDLPGQGVVDTWGGFRPGWAQSQGGREFQRLTRRLLDSELRQATGANAPESEVQTFRQILGLSETSSDEDVVRAMQQAREYIDSEFNALRGSYGPDAIRIWEEQARASRGRGTQAAIDTPPQPRGGRPQAGGAPPQRPQGDRVRVRRADGQTGSVSRAVFEQDQARPPGERRYEAVE
jgi:hypothetical protein